MALFDANLATFTRRIEQRTYERTRDRLLRLYFVLLIRTPIDTGHLRSNWRTRFNTLDRTIYGSKESVNNSPKFFAVFSQDTFYGGESSIVYFINPVIYGPVVNSVSHPMFVQRIVALVT